MQRKNLRFPCVGAIAVALLSQAFQPPATAQDRKAEPAKPASARRTPQATAGAALAQPPATVPRVIPAPTVVLKDGQVPGIEFDTPKFVFGRVMAGTVVTHDFWFTNTGNGPLEILAVRPSCGCTTSGEYDRIVEPGATARIPIVVATKRLAGKLTKTVTVHTNIPSPYSAATLQIQGEIWQPVEVSPRSAVFGRLTSSSEVVRKLVIKNNTTATMKLQNVRSENSVFRVRLREVEAGKQAEIVVSIAPPFPTGNVSGRITIETGVPEQPLIEIYASAHVPAPIEVTPNRLSLSNQSLSKQPFKRRLWVRNNDDRQSLTVSEVIVSDPRIKAHVTESVPGRTYQIVLEFPANYIVPPGGDRVTIRTNAASMPQVTVPIVERQTPAASPPGPTRRVSPAGVRPKAPAAAPRKPTG